MDSVMPYASMLVKMVPLIAVANSKRFFGHSIQVKLINEKAMCGWAARWRYLVFKLNYGFDFVSIEFSSGIFNAGAYAYLRSTLHDYERRFLCAIF